MIINYFDDCCDNCRHADVDYNYVETLGGRDVHILCTHMEVCGKYQKNSDGEHSITETEPDTENKSSPMGQAALKFLNAFYKSIQRGVIPFACPLCGCLVAVHTDEKNGSESVKCSGCGLHIMEE